MNFPIGQVSFKHILELPWISIKLIESGTHRQAAQNREVLETVVARVRRAVAWKMGRASAEEETSGRRRGAAGKATGETSG